MRLALAALVAFVTVPVLAADKPEPKYEGKPLAYWVAQFQQGETPKQREPAVEALKAFGPDAAPALPTFIEMLADHSPAYRDHVLAIVQEIGPAAKDARSAVLKALKAKNTKPFDFRFVLDVFVAISPTPKDAVSSLAPLLEDEQLGTAVFDKLCAIGPAAKDALPALPALHRYTLKRIVEAPTEFVTELRKVGPSALPLLLELLEAHQGRARHEALTCLEALGPKAAPAVPGLQKLLKHKDLHTRYRVAVLLWACDKNPAGVPVLAELLTQLPPIFRTTPGAKRLGFSASEAAFELGEIGPKASEALPALRRMVITGCAASVLEGCDSSPSRITAVGAVVLPPEGWYEVNSLISLVELGHVAEAAITKIEQSPNK